MIERSHIIDIPVHKNTMQIIRKRAGKACIGGKSNIREGRDREESLMEDQITGQLGNYALSKYLFGNPQQYLLSRYVAEKNPNVGDGGEDVIGLNIDIKATMYRYPNKDMLDYNLVVRERELHKNWIYIFALADMIENDSTIVHLIGWATTDMLPSKPAKEGIFKDAYSKPVRELYPLFPMEWMI